MNPKIPVWGIDQLNIMDMGHCIQMAGAIYADDEVIYLCMFPDEPMEDRQVRVLELNQENWKAVIRQTDLLETEVLQKAADGKLIKAIVRKSTRQIEQGISWAVFRRDGFRCRYCGNGNVPLTVDHAITWEDGGPSIEANLLASCRKCNKARGRTPYEKWIKGSYYRKKSKMLPSTVKAKNEALVATLPSIPRRTHKRSR